MKIHFEKVTSAHLDTIFNWLAEPHIMEFWDNTQAHKDDIVNFAQGRKTPSTYIGGRYVYWIAYIEDEAFAMLMTIQETHKEDIGEEKLKRLSKTGHTYGLDYMIGSLKFFGKGYGAQTLTDFINYFREIVDPKADTFLIDPASDNPKAKHVYMKAGFKHVCDFMMEGDVSGAGKVHHLLLRKFDPTVSIIKTTSTVPEFVVRTSTSQLSDIDAMVSLSKAKRLAYEKAQPQFWRYAGEEGDFINNKSIMPTLDLARKLIAEQFPEYASLPIFDVEKQGHDNRTYRLGDHMLIRMPTTADYALKVPKEQELLPELAKRLSINIPAPIKMGKPSAYTEETSAVASKMSGELAQPILIGEYKRNPKFDDANVKVSKVDYPYPFSIYKWLPGKSINLLTLTDQNKEQLAFDLANFLKELQAITDVEGPKPGQHNWWRGDHVSVYDKEAREQIAELAEIIDASKALALWERACATRWNKAPVWIHGDFAIGNILMDGGKLSAVIDFGGAAVGDPACDLVIAWTYLSGKAREVFISEMDMDPDTWLRARAWALWKSSYEIAQIRASKATFELCHIADKNSPEAQVQKQIIDEVMNG